MNLLVTFSVNFPQQEECSSSLGQHVHTQLAQEPARDSTLQVASSIKIGGCQVPAWHALAQERGAVAVSLNNMQLGILAGGKN